MPITSEFGSAHATAALLRRCLLATAVLVLGACDAGSPPAQTSDPTGDATASSFAQAILDGDYQAASRCMTKAMQSLVPAARLQRMMEEAASTVTAPTGFSLDHGSMTADLLREEFRDNEVPFPDDVTSRNYVAWTCIEMRNGEERSYDLWVAVVADGNAKRIGYFRRTVPD